MVPPPPDRLPLLAGLLMEYLRGEEALQQERAAVQLLAQNPSLALLLQQPVAPAIHPLEALLGVLQQNATINLSDVVASLRALAPPTGYAAQAVPEVDVGGLLGLLQQQRGGVPQGDLFQQGGQAQQAPPQLHNLLEQHVHGMNMLPPPLEVLAAAADAARGPPAVAPIALPPHASPRSAEDMDRKPAARARPNPKPPARALARAEASSSNEDGSTSNEDTTGVGEGPMFPTLLRRMLLDAQSNGQDDIIRFTSQGDAIVILNREALITDLVPHYFRMKSMASFRRQLCLYGFVKCIRDGNQAYRHDLFHRDRPEQLEELRRLPRKQSPKKG